MSTAAKLVASTETAKAGMTIVASKGSESLRATAGSHAPQEEAQRRKWGVETGAVRSVHARKF
jgi:hypothetical protein